MKIAFLLGIQRFTDHRHILTQFDIPRIIINVGWTFHDQFTVGKIRVMESLDDLPQPFPFPPRPASHKPKHLVIGHILGAPQTVIHPQRDHMNVVVIRVKQFFVPVARHNQRVKHAAQTAERARQNGGFPHCHNSRELAFPPAFHHLRSHRKHNRPRLIGPCDIIPDSVFDLQRHPAVPDMVDVHPLDIVETHQRMPVSTWNLCSAFCSSFADPSMLGGCSPSLRSRLYASMSRSQRRSFCSMARVSLLRFGIADDDMAIPAILQPKQPSTFSSGWVSRCFMVTKQCWNRIRRQSKRLLLRGSHRIRGLRNRL